MYYEPWTARAAQYTMSPVTLDLRNTACTLTLGTEQVMWGLCIDYSICWWWREDARRARGHGVRTERHTTLQWEAMNYTESSVRILGLNRTRKTAPLEEVKKPSQRGSVFGRNGSACTIWMNPQNKLKSNVEYSNLLNYLHRLGWPSLPRGAYVHASRTLYTTKVTL